MNPAAERTDSAVRRVLGLLSERGFSLAFALVTTVLLARSLGADAFGKYSMSLAVVSLVAPLCTLGLNHILTRDISLAPQDAHVIVSSATRSRLAGGLVGIVAVVLIVRFGITEWAEILPVAVILSSAVLFRAFGTTEFYFLAIDRTTPVVLLKIGAAATATILVAVGTRVDLSLLWLTILRSVEFMVLGIGFVFLYRTIAKRGILSSPSKQLAKDQVRRSWPLILSSMMAVVYLKIDQLMLGEMVGAKAAGTYAVAAQLSEVWYVVPEAIAAATFTRLLEAKKKGIAEYWQFYQRLLDGLSFLGLCIAVAVSVTAPLLIRLIYGAEYIDAVPILQVHVWACMFIFIRAGFSKYLIAEQKLIESLLTHGAGAIASILLNLLLIPSFGGVGAAVSSLIAYFVASIGSLFLFRSTRPSAVAALRALFVPFRYPVFLFRTQRMNFKGHD